MSFYLREYMCHHILPYKITNIFFRKILAMTSITTLSRMFRFKLKTRNYYKSFWRRTDIIHINNNLWSSDFKGEWFHVTRLRLSECSNHGLKSEEIQSSIHLHEIHSSSPCSSIMLFKYLKYYIKFVFITFKNIYFKPKFF